MKILTSNIVLKRGPLAKPTDEKGPKLYYDLNNNIVDQKIVYHPINSLENKAKAPSLSISEAHELTQTLDNWFVIPEDNLIIIDTDSLAAEDFMAEQLAEYHQQFPDALSTYRVESDTGFSHYYYQSTEYYRESPLYHTNRRQLKKMKIDILQGQAGAWGPGENNHLKFAPSYATLLDAQPIPNEIVDALLRMYNFENVTQQRSDYSPFVHNIGVQLEKALQAAEHVQMIYSKINSSPPPEELWEPFHGIAEYIIPNKYKGDMEYPWNPDTIDVEASANEFVQAMVTKLLRDNSISAEVIRTLAVLITTEVWSRPISLEQCISYMTNLETQAFGEPPVCYSFNPDLLEAPQICINSGAARPIYRGVKGNILVEGAKGLIDFGAYKTFSATVRSKGFDILPDPVLIKRQKEPTDDFLGHVHTIKEVDTIVKPTGLQEAAPGATREFNTYVRTTLHNIILGIEPEPAATPEDFPTIMKLLKSITYDHSEIEGEQERLLEYFQHLIAHKGKTFFYSPLVFQMNGKGGRGKGAIVSLLGLIFGKTFQVDFTKNDLSNNDQMNALWGSSSELPVSTAVEERIKDRSGEGRLRSRKLYTDAQYVDNIATLMVSTNMAKIFTDARRFVLFSCFRSTEKFTSMDYSMAVGEIRRWCAYLRDRNIRDLRNKEALVDSSYWNGEIQAATKAIVAEVDEASTVHDLYNLYVDHAELSGTELHEQLESLLGTGYWAIPKPSQASIWLICYAPNLTKGGVTCTHTVTAKDAKELGMFTGRNTTSSTVEKQGFETVGKAAAYSYIKMKLSNAQLKEYVATSTGIVPLGETL